MFRMVIFAVNSFARSSLLRDLVITALIIIVGPRISSQRGGVGGQLSTLLNQSETVQQLVSEFHVYGDN